MAYSGPGKNVREKLRLEIMYDLGYPVVKVEVIQPWIDNAIDRAIQMWSKYTPQSEAWTTFSAVNMVNKYRVPDDYVTIKEVIYRPMGAYSNLYSLVWPYWGNWFSWFYQGSLTDFFVTSEYLRMGEKVLGWEGTWNFTYPYLYLYPTPERSVPVFVKYQKMITDENLIRDDKWIKDYALAIVKERLGRARSKFSSLTGPKGDISLDGTTLIAEAREDRIRLEDQLRGEHEETLGFLIV